MDLVKVYLEDSLQTVLTVSEGETVEEIEQRIADDFLTDASNVKVARRVAASDVIRVLGLNPGDSFVDG